MLKIVFLKWSKFWRNVEPNYSQCWNVWKVIHILNLAFQRLLFSFLLSRHYNLNIWTLKVEHMLRSVKIDCRKYWINLLNFWKASAWKKNRKKIWKRKNRSHVLLSAATVYRRPWCGPCDGLYIYRRKAPNVRLSSLERETRINFFLIFYSRYAQPTSRLHPLLERLLACSQLGRPPAGNSLWLIVSLASAYFSLEDMSLSLLLLDA